MPIDVLVEPSAGGGFVARSGAPFDLTATAETADQAVAAIRDQIDSRLKLGAQVIQLPLLPPATGAGGTPAAVNPWLKIAGMWKDDPSFDDFLKEIERYRAEVDADPNRF